MNECKFEGCTNKKAVRGYCRGHYAQLSRGKELKPLRNYNMDSHVDESGRVCTKCNSHKPWDEFYPLKVGINGRAPKCKECTKVEATERYHAKR